jgi:hypothetical protein
MSEAKRHTAAEVIEALSKAKGIGDFTAQRAAQLAVLAELVGEDPVEAAQEFMRAMSDLVPKNQVSRIPPCPRG